MSVPFNVFDPADAFVLTVRPQTGDLWGRDIFDEVQTAFTKAEEFLVVIEETLEPPWENDEIRSAIEAGQRRQCLILSQHLSSFTMATSMMAIEQGLRVFVCSEDAADQFFNVTRLVQASATVLTGQQLVAELRLGRNYVSEE